MRNERFSTPLAAFLIKILDQFKIYQRVEALKIYSEEILSEQIKHVIELCYFVEGKGMNAISTENFLVEKINIPMESSKINTRAVQCVTFHKSKGLEWPVVILPFMYRKRQLKEDIVSIFISKEQRVDELYANSCRLLYVACTWVKIKLVILDDSEFCEKNSLPNMVSSREILLTKN